MIRGLRISCFLERMAKTQAKCQTPRASLRSVFLFDLFVNRVTAQRGIVLLLFQALRMRLEIFLSGVARGGFALFTSLCALERNNTNFALLLSHGVLRNRSVYRTRANSTSAKGRDA